MYAPTRDDDMQMGMEVEASGMRMEDGGHGDVGAEETGMVSEVFEGSGGGVEKQVVDE